MQLAKKEKRIVFNNSRKIKFREFIQRKIDKHKSAGLGAVYKCV